MKTNRLILIPGVILAVLCLTNPGPEAHYNAARGRIAEKSPLADIIVGATATKALRYENHYLWSTTKLGNEPITIGVCGFTYCRPWSRE